MRGVTHARRPMDADAHVVVAEQRRFARVESHAHMQRPCVRPRPGE